jgi:hypothetical protein
MLGCGNQWVQEGHIGMPPSTSGGLRSVHVARTYCALQLARLSAPRLVPNSENTKEAVWRVSVGWSSGSSR